MGNAASGASSSGWDPIGGEVKKGQDTWNKLKKGDVGGAGQAWYQQEKENNKRILGMSTKDQERELERSRRTRQEGDIAARGVLDTMEGHDLDYDRKAESYTNNYIGDVRKLRNQTRQQAQDARLTYTNDIQPRYKNVMEDAQFQASQAMGLREAGDPNNRVHQAVRGMYDQEAQNTGRQGLANAGVLSSLGAQATAQQFGVGGPMTGAQMQLMSAANQQQSGAAFARTQQQMERLRQQGIERGFQESDAQYARGQMAKDRYDRSINQYEGGMDRNINRQRGFRGELQGYEADIFGTTMGRAREGRDIRQGIGQRDLAHLGKVYGGKQEGIAQQIALQNAQNAAQANMIGGVLGAAGSIGGAYFGGAGGAAAGGQVGQAAGGGATAAPTPGVNYQMYNYGPQPAGQNQAGYYPQR